MLCILLLNNICIDTHTAQTIERKPVRLNNI